MHYSSIALGLSLTTLASAAGYYPRASTGGCVGDGAVHMIVARASTEPAGEGIIGSVATMVKKQLPGSDSEAVVYPATLQSYISSESAGVTAMKKLVQDYAAKCPTSKIAVMGYSQGANVAADVMCGSSGMGGGMGMGFGLGTMGAGSGATQGSSDGLSADVAKNVVAMVLMGDPTHVPTDSFNAGTSKKAGMFPRKNSANCPADKTVSYCDTGDTFCDSGMSTAVHLGYVTKYGTAAAKFITDKVSGSSTSTSTSNGTASSGGTSGAAASGAASGASSLGGLGSSGASSLGGLSSGMGSLGSSGASSLGSLGSSGSSGKSSLGGLSSGMGGGLSSGMGGGLSSGMGGGLSSLFGGGATKARAPASKRDVLTREASNDGGKNGIKLGMMIGFLGLGLGFLA